MCQMPDSDGALKSTSAQPEPRAPNLTMNMQHNVGGALGLGSSSTSATIWLEKSRFTQGEEIRVHIDINNSACKKPVKWVKTYLRRIVTFFEGSGNQVQTQQGFDAIEDEFFRAPKHPPNVNASESKEVVVKFNLPSKDKDYGSTKGMHADLQHMTAMFSESCENAFFKVQYELDVYVKH